MSKIKTLEKNCALKYAATRRARERLAKKTATGIRKTEDFFRSDKALIGAFTAGVVVDQVQDRRDEGGCGKSDQKSRKDSQPAKDGIQWTPLLIRMAFPYVLQGLMNSSETGDMPQD